MERRADKTTEGGTGMRRLALAAACAFALCDVAHAQSSAELKAPLDQARRPIQDRQARVKALEEQKAKAAAPTAAAAPEPPPAVGGAPVVAPGAVAEEGTANAGNARAEVYGQVMVDAIYDA